MNNQFGSHDPIQISEVKNRKVRSGCIVQCGMNEYYIALFIFRDRKRYVLYNTADFKPRTFMSIDTAARYLRQNYVRKIEVVML